MKAPEHFEVLESYCCYRLSGHGRLEEAARKVIEVDTTGWTGHASPDTLERFTVVQACAEASRSKVKLAMVVRPEMMDPEKFEVTVATNRGLDENVFDSEKDALAWLLDPDVRRGLPAAVGVFSPSGNLRLIFPGRISGFFLTCELRKPA